ncbi:hypothetical protein EVAR_102467_1 [Eumeta japonica]|uniref:Uncharacterized protein n=1 Tax=Eumeta variegata TaxID=151549 RepID=A0A4C1ZVU3_EUMVA|nr:hypothetical protein EVAR_102467_1 [Eumeta japonica]
MAPTPLLCQTFPELRFGVPIDGSGWPRLFEANGDGRAISSRRLSRPQTPDGFHCDESPSGVSARFGVSMPSTWPARLLVAILVPGRVALLDNLFSARRQGFPPLPGEIGVPCRFAATAFLSPRPLPRWWRDARLRSRTSLFRPV